MRGLSWLQLAVICAGIALGSLAIIGFIIDGPEELTTDRPLHATSGAPFSWER